MSTQFTVITTIAPPTEQARQLANLAGWHLLAVGDKKTPVDWQLQGATYLGVEDQALSRFELARWLPFNHYSRKNLGYLEAMRRGATQIFESDDDNRPLPGFVPSGDSAVEGALVSGNPWVNIYPLYTDRTLWPRGLPLDEIGSQISTTSRGLVYSCPIRQYLAEGDPDVDAVYRLTFGHSDHEFTRANYVLERGSYTPFNSQSTCWAPRAYPLMYLPSFVNFRMTDIWRSFIAQACLHAMGDRLAYMGPGVHQDRNLHNLMNDFEDEVPGYLNNHGIIRRLERLDLDPEPAAAVDNLMHCYSALVEDDYIPRDELRLLEAWKTDLQALGPRE